MQTARTDGTGYGPAGAPCTYIMSQSRCAMACNGGPECPGWGMLRYRMGVRFDDGPVSSH